MRRPLCASRSSSPRCCCRAAPARRPGQSAAVADSPAAPSLAAGLPARAAAWPAGDPRRLAVRQHRQRPLRLHHRPAHHRRNRRSTPSSIVGRLRHLARLALRRHRHARAGRDARPPSEYRDFVDTGGVADHPDDAARGMDRVGHGADGAGAARPAHQPLRLGAADLHAVRRRRRRRRELQHLAVRRVRGLPDAARLQRQLRRPRAGRRPCTRSAAPTCGSTAASI